jgi:flagellar basal-body rod modification protein FlgD
MTVSGTGNTGSFSTQYTTKTNATGDQIENPNAALRKNDFLQMLITKLANQDPLSAKMDESFMADMAQFSSLEQATNMSTALGLTNDSIMDMNKNLIGLMMMQNTSQAASLIGKTVTVQYDVLDSKGNVVMNSQGNPVKALTSGPVDMVKFVDGVPQISIGGKLYQLSQVQEISA